LSIVILCFFEGIGDWRCLGSVIVETHLLFGETNLWPRA
jgi:hypothetical protein